MSDVSITALVAKAREAVARSRWFDTGEEPLIAALADALEAVTVPAENEREALPSREAVANAILMVTQEGVPAEYAWAVQYVEVQDELFAQADAVLALFAAGFRLPVTVPGENERRLLIEILDDDLKYDIGEACPVFQVGMAADAILDAGFRIPVPVEREWGLSDSMLKTFPRPHFTSTEENVKTQQRRGHPAIKVVSRVVSRWRFVPREKVDTQ